MKQVMNKKKMVTYIFPAIIGLVAGLSAPMILNMAVFFGRHIPQDNLYMDYTVGLLWAILLGAGILAWPVRFSDKKTIAVIWMIKIIVVLGFMLFYEYHYSTDSFGYFNISDKMDFGLNTDSARNTRIFDGFLMVSNLAWIIQHVAPNSYHAMKISFAMIGLVGIYIFYRSAVLFLGYDRKYLFYALALFPSVLFWTGTLGKEPVMIFGLSLYVYGAAGWYRFKRLRYALILLPGIFIVLIMRLWFAPILVMPLIVFLLDLVRRRWLKIALVAGGITASFILMGPILHDWHIDSIQSFIAKINSLAAGLSTGGSGSGVKVKFTDLRSLLLFIPKGMFTALFRPMPGEVNNVFGLAAGVESVSLVVLTVIALIRFKRRDLMNSAVVWAALFILLWDFIYGFVSVFNLGTMVRYRTMILPVLLIFLLYFIAVRREGKI